jgi:hypothetical protein
MTNAVIVLAIAALGGLTLTAIRLRGTPRPPTWMALAHGAIAATGLGLLIDAAATTQVPTLAHVAIGFFVLAALGGLTLFLGFHMRGRELPIPFVLGHGLVAITAYVLLLISHFRGS